MHGRQSVLRRVGEGVYTRDGRYFTPAKRLNGHPLRFLMLLPRPKGTCWNCCRQFDGAGRYCSDGCRADARVRSGNHVYARSQVFKRDRGICSLCGLDCEQAMRVLARVAEYGEDWRLSAKTGRPVALPTWKMQDAETKAAREFLLRLWTGVKSPTWTATLWHADHIVPISRGGAGCGLDGYRTLCVKCHYSEGVRLGVTRG